MPDPAADAWMFASADVPAHRARQWLTDRFEEQAARAESGALSFDERADISELLSIAWWDSAINDDDEDHELDRTTLLTTVLPLAVRAAAGIPLGSPVLALYLRNVINAAWALAWDHDLLIEAVEAACAEAESVTDDASGPVAPLAWRLLRFMRHEFDVETAVLTGRLGAVTRVSAQAVAAIDPLVREIETLEPSSARSALLREADNERIYYRVVRDTSSIIRRMLAREPIDDPAAELKRLHAEAASGAFNPMDASELRGHLGAADTIAAAMPREWVHVDAGRVHIVYPFGIRVTGRTAPAAVIETVRAGALAAQRDGGMLGGLAIEEVLNRLDLSDAWWQGSDSLGRGYRGSTIRLADIVLEEILPDGTARALDVIHPRIQLSELGNHVIVFDVDLEDAPAFRVAEAVNLATPVFGNLEEIPDYLRLRSEADDGETMARVSDAVAGILDGIREILDRPGSPVGADAVAAREGSFGLIVAVDAASRVTADGVEPLASAQELMSLWGMQPLVHPLPSGAASVADWAMYDVKRVDTFGLLHLNDELLVSNANVTLLASFHSPQYALAEIESFIEFAHSMHGMYQGWQDTVRVHAERIADLLHEVDGVLERSDDVADRVDDEARRARAAVVGDLDDLLRRIERAELWLQTFVQSNEATMLFIESPSIVSSPPLRTDLDTVLRSNHYDGLRAGFTRAVQEVLGRRLQPLLEVVHGRVQNAYEKERAEAEARAAQAARERETQRLRREADAARARAAQDALRAQEQERRDRQNERVSETLGIGFGIVGLSGLASILQEGLDWKGPGVWWIVMAIVGAAFIGAAILFFWTARVSRQRRSAADAAERDAAAAERDDIPAHNGSTEPDGAVASAAHGDEP